MTDLSGINPVGFNWVEHTARQREQQMGSVFSRSAKTSPDAFAEAKKLASETGRTVEEVTKDPEAARGWVQRKQIESAAFSKDFPLLSRSLQNVDFLPMVRDDLGNLQATEGTFDWITRSWRVARATSERGTIGTMAGLSGRGFTAHEQRRIDRIDELSRAHAARDAGFTGAAVELVGSMLDTAATAVATGAITSAAGAPAAAPFTAGAAAFAQSMRLEAGNLYVDLLAQGYTPAEAQPLAGMFGAAIGAVDLVGLKIAAKPFKETAGALLPKVFARGLTPQTRTAAFKDALKAYGAALVAEPTTEAIQEVLGMSAKEVARINYGDADAESQFDMGEAAHAFTHTLKGMVVLGGLGAGGHYVSDLRKAGEAKHTARVFKAQTEARADSKLAERDPEARAAFVNEKVEGTPAETVFVRGDKFAEVLRQAETAEAEESGRSTVMESLEQLMPGLADQVKEAEATGGDVAISTGDWDAKLSTSPVGQAVIPHATWDADGMTAAEAKTWETQRQAEADHYREQSEENMARDADLAASAREVEDIMYAQLQDVGVTSSKDSRASAQLYRDFVVTQAADLNISPKEFYDRYPLRVARGQSSKPADKLRSGARGNFDPTRLVATLNETADASTFLHESSHYFLTVYADLAAADGAPDRVTSDMGALLKSFGVESVDAWNEMTLDQQREHHEAFAYNFEQYLFDGKAPSAELRALMQRFASWLRRLYRGIRGRINATYRVEFGKDLPILSGEVRSVMDRMLASEEQIAAAEHVRGMVPMFQTQEESGMSDSDWEAYQENAGRAHDEAINRLAEQSLANMQWLSSTRSRVLKEKQAEAAETRAAVREEVKAEVEQRPVYKAMHYLKRGEVRSEDGSATADPDAKKLDNETVQQMLGKAPKRPRKKRRQSLTTFIASKGGISHSSWSKSYPGETKGEFRISGVFRGKAKDTDARGTTGMPWEQMAALARENGYGPQLADGATIENEDTTWFVEAIADAAQGQHTYTEESTDAKAAAESEAAASALQGLVKQLGYGKYGMLQNEGLHPDRVAEAYGFPSGQALVEALLNAPKIADAIETATDARMLAEHGDLVDQEQVQLAVEEAVHNEARAKFVTIELKALAKVTQPTRLMTEAAKEAARQILATKTLREIRPRDFSIAEARHGREAYKALQEGDTAAAIVAKQKQLVQFHLAKQAAEAQLEVQKGNKQFRRVFQSDVKLAKTRDVNIIQAARAVLTLYDLGQASRNPMEWLKPVAEYDELTFADIEADVQFAIDQSARLDDGGRKVPAKWKSLTLEQYRDLGETIDALWQKSRRTKQVFIDGKRQSRDAIAARAVEQVESLPAKKRLAGNKGAVDNAKKGTRSYVAQARRAEFVLRDLDGGTPGVFTSLFRRIKEAANAFREQARTELNTYEKRLKDHNWGPDVAIDGRRFLLDGNDRATHSGVFKNKAELLGVMQHLGNASNKKKALVSEGWAELREDGTIDSAVWDAFEAEMLRAGVLVKADYDLLQAIWDQNESHKPALQKAHYENHGYHWREIEAQPLTVTFPDGTQQRYRGGYVPAGADKDRVPLAAKQDINTKAAMQNALPIAPRGFTKERNENYIEPQRHDLNASGHHMVEVLRYIHMQSAVTDVNRVLSHDSVSKALQAYDPALITNVFTPWLKQSAEQRVGETEGNPAFRGLSRVASNTNMGIMSGNVGNSLQNFTGLIEALTVAKPKHMLSAIASYIGGGARATALEKSSELRGRAGRQMVEVRNEIRRQVAGAGKVRRALDWVRENAYFMQQITQDVVDTIVWTASYNQALSRGESEQESIRRGDAAIRQTQMATDPEDVSQWESEKGFVRSFFPFQSWFIRWANNQSSNWKNPAEAGGRVAAVIYGYALPLVLAQLVSDMVNGRLEDEDDDGWGDEAADLTLRSIVGGTLAAVPVFGKPASSLANSWLDDDVWNDRMPAPPFIEAFERARRAIASDDMDERDARDLASFFGNAVGIPLGAILSRFSYAARAAQGETDPGGPFGETFDTVRGLVTGRGR